MKSNNIFGYPIEIIVLPTVDRLEEANRGSGMPIKPMANLVRVTPSPVLE